MKNSLVSVGLAIALAVPAATVPVGATAQSPGDVARARCEDAAVNKIRRQDGSAGRISFSGAKLRQVSNAETGVSGKGSYSNRSFSYQCVYNIRDGHTSNVSVRVSGGGQDNPSGGAVAGAIIGAVIAGAIIGAIDNNAHSNTQSKDDGWWSPGGNVSCNSYQSYCEEQGRYSAKWTHKIYGN